MNFGVLLSLLLSHVIADFTLQSESIVKMRMASSLKIILKGNLLHSLIVFIITIFITISYLNYSSFYLIGMVFFISLTHFFIDLTKSFLIYKKPFFNYSILYFITDQLLHTIIIFIFSTFITINLSKNKLTLYLFNNILTDSIKFNNLSINYSEKLILSLFLFVAGVWGVGVFITIFCKYLKNREFKNAINKGILIKENFLSKTGIANGGHLIGLLERIFIIISIVLIKPELIGFVLTTKSIARFKKFDDDSFVEYFIIGTFISFISAIIIGILIKNLRIIPNY